MTWMEVFGLWGACFMTLPSPLPKPLQEVLCTHLFLSPKDLTVSLRPSWPFLASGPPLDLP